MQLNQFAERYKSRTTAELLSIIEQAHDYQPAAVEAARQELSDRQLSQDDLQEAEAALEAHRQEAASKAMKRERFERRIQEIGTTFADTLSPIQQANPSADKQILLISIAFGAISLYQLLNEFSPLFYLLFEEGGWWDAGMLFYVAPLVLLPLATVLFWLRKPTGWVLMSVYLTYSAVNANVLMLLSWNQQPVVFADLEALFPRPNPILYLLVFALYGGTLWVICREGVRIQYSLKRGSMLVSIIGTAGLTSLGLLSFLL